MRYVPVMLNLEGRRCVIIGGGAVAERKAASLTDSGADVVVISPMITARLQTYYEDNQLVWEQRGYRNGDLKGAFLAYAATDQPDINDAVVLEAELMGIPVNHTGEGERGSFISPSTVRRGRLIVAVSTSGAGPAASLKLSREIDDYFGDIYETYVDFISDVRIEVKRRVKDKDLRSRLLKSLVDMDILTAIREGRFKPWSEAELMAWIDGYREG